MNILVDANVILRYLLDDVPEMAEKANEIIKDGAYTTPEILASRVFLTNCLWTKRPLLNML